MVQFHERLEAYRTDMGLLRSDLADILDKSPQTLSAYLTDDESWRRVPQYPDLMEIPSRLGVSLDWITGNTDGFRWSTEIQELQPWLRAACLELPAGNVMKNVTAIIRFLEEKLPLARQDWWMAGALGLGSQDMKTNAETYQRFRQGLGISDPVLKRVVIRLADLTSVPDMWIETGDEKWLSPETKADLREWGEVFDQAQHVGLRPDQIRLHMDTIVRLIKSYEAS